MSREMLAEYTFLDYGFLLQTMSKSVSEKIKKIPYPQSIWQMFHGPSTEVCFQEKKAV